MSYTAAVITVSDKGSRGERVDTSGPMLCELLKSAGYEVVYTAIVPDEAERIRFELLKCSDEKNIALVLTTGGTGFSPRDITPEATKSILERETPGIPEAMRAESMKITPHGCLSRETAGIRGRTLIINLPGSEKAARENFSAVLGAVAHGLKMLYSEGSAECAAASAKKSAPSAEQWLKEAKSDKNAAKCGMYLLHNGTVRADAKATVRNGASDVPPVTGLHLSYDAAKVDEAVLSAKQMPGIYYVRVWLNEGELAVGDDMMLVLVGGDIRPRVVDALQSLVDKLKNECVTETERF